MDRAASQTGLKEALRSPENPPQRNALRRSAPLVHSPPRVPWPRHRYAAAQTSRGLYVNQQHEDTPIPLSVGETQTLSGYFIPFGTNAAGACPPPGVVITSQPPSPGVVPPGGGTPPLIGQFPAEGALCAGCHSMSPTLCIPGLPEPSPPPSAWCGPCWDRLMCFLVAGAPPSTPPDQLRPSTELVLMEVDELAPPTPPSSHLGELRTRWNIWGETSEWRDERNAWTPPPQDPGPSASESVGGNTMSDWRRADNGWDTSPTYFPRSFNDPTTVDEATGSSSLPARPETASVEVLLPLRDDPGDVTSVPSGQDGSPTALDMDVDPGPQVRLASQVSSPRSATSSETREHAFAERNLAAYRARLAAARSSEEGHSAASSPPRSPPRRLQRRS